MEKIYKTKYGAVIDLSEILSIEPITDDIHSTHPHKSYKNAIVQVAIHTKSDREAIILQVIGSHCQTVAEYVQRNKEAFEDLVRAWTEFSKQTDTSNIPVEQIQHKLIKLIVDYSYKNWNLHKDKIQNRSIIITFGSQEQISNHSINQAILQKTGLYEITINGIKQIQSYE